MRQSVGTRSVPSRPVPGIADPSVVDLIRADFQTWQARFRRELTFGWLRLSLFLAQSQWLERASQAAIGGFDRAGLRHRNLELARRHLGHPGGPDHPVAKAGADRERALCPAVGMARARWCGSSPISAASPSCRCSRRNVFKQPEVAALREPAPRPAWIEVDKPWPAFEMSVPGITEDMHYAIQRRTDGGGRKDTMSFGELGKTPRFASVEIYRAGPEIDDLRQNRRRDRSARLRIRARRRHGGGDPDPIQVRLFQVFEFAIKPFKSYRCIGFANAFDDQRVQITGVACNMNTIVDRSTLSCALDRLSLVWAASDPEITRLFAHAELRRNFCGQRDAPISNADAR